MSQITNLNVSPYYDDFDKFKNFYKVLFRPGFPIQARELTTLQSILQNQVESIGTHLFKDGAMVIPGQVGWDNNVDCILVQSSFLGAEVEEYRTSLLGTTLTGVTSGVKAEIIKTISAAESTEGFITLYIKYTESGGADKTIKKLLNNEQILVDTEITYGTTLIEIGTPVAQLIPNNAARVGSVAYVNSGVYFIRGFFVDVIYQSLILDQYSVNPTYRIGLEVSESIITAEDDTSLNDNAAGSSNYAAPGAHRFKLTATLVKKDIDDDADKNFYELLRLKSGKVELKVDETKYSELEKRFANQVYDLAGDFMIKPFDIKVRESLNDNFNDGVYLPGQYTQDTSVLASDDLYAVQISPGKVYLKGYPIERDTPTYLDLPKPRSYKSLDNNIIPFELGNIANVTKVYGAPVLSGPDINNSYQVIEFRDAYTVTPGTGTGNVIGLARIASWEFNSSGTDTTEGNLTDIYDASLFDVSMFTKLYLAASVTIEGGSLIRGKTSGATGFIRLTSGTSFTGQTLTLVNVIGEFRKNEVIEVDGKDKSTINGVYAYQYSDVRQIVGKNNLGVTILTGDVQPLQTVKLGGDQFTYSVISSQGYLTGYNSNISPELRPGDLLYVSSTEFFKIDDVPANLDTSTIFNYSLQRFKVTPSTGFNPISTITTTATGTNGASTITVTSATGLVVGMTVSGTGIGTGAVIKSISGTTVTLSVPNSGTVSGTITFITSVIFTTVVRFRPVLGELQNADLFTEMPKEAIKTITDESMIIRRTYESQITSNSFTISLSENLQFEAVETENYNLTVTGVAGGSSYSIGDVLILQNNNSSAPAYTTFNTSGVPRSTITVSNLVGITSVRFNTAVSKNVVTEKVKNSNKMAIWKISRTSKSSDQIQYGLSYSNIYGIRIEDQEISLGKTDVYRLRAVYESLDNNDAVIPYITLVESSFFATGSLVTGKTSGAKAFVVDFNASTLRLSIVYENSSTFQQNETVSGFNSNGDAIEALISDATGSVNVGSKNITSSFVLESNQKEFFYDISRLVRKKGANTPIRKIKVVADYYSHESTGDYFNINSYVGTDYADIPAFTASSGSGSTVIRTKQLRDVLDFRPAVASLADGSGTLADPFLLNCSSFDFASRTFDDDNGATIFDIPKPDSDFRCDYSYYLKRIDKLFVDINGRFFIVQGKSEEIPSPPDDVSDAMLLATIAHNAYGYNVDIDSLIFKENIRRYTMRDIGLLDKRVQNVEYYSVLTLLEQETNALTIQDEFGNDKFKNGFFVDSFENQNVVDSTNEDYSASIDYSERVLRPSHYTTNISLIQNTTASTDVVRNQGLVTLPYTHEVLISQPYASRIENVNPFNVFTFLGGIELNPTSDDWVETEIAPVNVVRVEGDFTSRAREIGADQNGFGPQQWGSWVEDWSGARTTVSGGEFRGWLGATGRFEPAFGTRTTQTTGIIERRTGTQQRLIERFDTQSLGSRIINRTSIPFIRSRNIGIKAERLKPTTRFYAFFDNIAVSQYITPKLIELIKNPTQNPNTNSIPFQVGETVTIEEVSANGVVTTIFRAKVATLNDGYRYNPYTSAELTDVYSSETPYLNIDVNSLAEQVSADYYGNIQVNYIIRGLTSGARAVVKDRRLISDPRGSFKGAFFIPRANISTNPRWATGRRVFKLTTSEVDASATPGDTTTSSAQATYEASGVLETSQETILSIRNADVVNVPLSEQRTVTRTRQEQVQIGWWDPLAQSFIVQEKGGCYVSKVEVYFNSKDPSVPVSCQLRVMQSGIPTNRILPLSTVTVYPEDVEISENASIPTTFTFPAPCYLSDTEEYCFVIFSDSNKYTVWISEMGEVDITGDRTISSQPYAGVLFKSQNASTWTPNQLQDLKFNLYRAKFGPLSGKLVLNNAALGVGNRGIITLREDPILTQTPSLTLVLSSNTGSFTAGARIYQQTTNASATIKQLITSTNPYQLIVENVDGTFLQGSNIGGTITYPIISSQSTGSIVVTSPTGSGFVVGRTITGVTSGATAIVTNWNSGTNTITVNYVSKEFSSGETINQSGTPSMSATVNSASSTYSGDTKQEYLSLSPTFTAAVKKVTVFHSNHGMHDTTNNVVISGLTSEISPTTLRSTISATDVTLSVTDASAFHTTVNGLPVSSVNPGYIKIGSEIMAYESIGNEGTTITIKSSGRGLDGTTATSHIEGSFVECYNLDGIPLTELNKTHAEIISPTIDSYQLATSSVANSGIRGGGTVATASQNVAFEYLTPQIQTVVQSKTKVVSRINTITGTSINNGNPTEVSFINDGSFQEVTLNSVNYLEGQKLILSSVNEGSKLAGQKSFTMELLMTSESDLLTPVIDLDRSSIITTTNRINNPDNWVASEQYVGDPHDAIYITKMISLDNQVSRSLKVYFDAYKTSNVNFRVCYRVVPLGFSGNENQISWTFFNSDGGPDKFVAPDNVKVFRPYEYSATGLEFIKYQIKICMSSPNQAEVPQFKYFRALALAT